MGYRRRGIYPITINYKNSLLLIESSGILQSTESTSGIQTNIGTKIMSGIIYTHK